MNIVTKYDIGHTFWVPRSMDYWKTEELRHEGEIWERQVKEIRPSVKQKKIIKVEVSVCKTSEPLIQYYCINCEGDKNQLSQVYSEEKINDYTEEEALAIAKEYADRNETYYGT